MSQLLFDAKFVRDKVVRVMAQAHIARGYLRPPMSLENIVSDRIRLNLFFAPILMSLTKKIDAEREHWL